MAFRKISYLIPSCDGCGLARSFCDPACGEGQLIMIRGAGHGGVQVGAAVSLRIYREPGEPENDPTARQNKVKTLVAQAFKRVESGMRIVMPSVAKGR